MTTIAHFFSKVSSWCEKIGFLLASICGISILLVISFNVFARVFLPMSFLWPAECARFLLISGVFLGGSAAWKSNGLVRLDVVVTLFPKKVQDVVSLICEIGILLFLFLLLYESIVSVPQYAAIIADTMPISQMWPELGMVLGIIFMIIHTVNMLLERTVYK